MCSVCCVWCVWCVYLTSVSVSFFPHVCKQLLLFTARHDRNAQLAESTATTMNPESSRIRSVGVCSCVSRVFVLCPMYLEDIQTHSNTPTHTHTRHAHTRRTYTTHTHTHYTTPTRTHTHTHTRAHTHTHNTHINTYKLT